MHNFLLLAGMFSLAFTVRGDLTSLSSTNCVAPAEFLACRNKATSTAESCVRAAQGYNEEDEIIACGCNEGYDTAQCYGQYCWNRAWECEYQTAMRDFFAACPIATVPIAYFPLPAGSTLPDACSCDVGKVLLSSKKINSYAGVCGASLVNAIACSCCAVSGTISSAYDICPDTDPQLLDPLRVQQSWALAGFTLESCASHLEGVDCVRDLGFPSQDISRYYAASDLPPSGTATPSNLPGTVTVPPGGNVFSYSNYGVEYTISAASVTGGSGSGGGGGTRGGGGEGPTSTRASGSNPSSSSTKSAAGVIHIPMCYAMTGITIAALISIGFC